jgi:hypothetical protein
MTLGGAMLTVGASSLFYIHLSVATVLWDSTVKSNEWLNPYVHAASLNSIFNDIGMVLACGVLKNVAMLQIGKSRNMMSLSVRPLSNSNSAFSAGEAEPSIVFDFNDDRSSTDLTRPAAPPVPTNLEE